MNQVPPAPVARERILGAAGDLFYSSGINATGVDALIQRAGVAKASLYNNFSGKEELVVAYLDRARESWLGEARAADRPAATAARRVDRLFALLEKHAARSTFHGCPFLSAAVELPESQVVREAVLRYQEDRHDHLASLLGGRDASLLASVAVLYDGAMAGAKLTRGVGPVRAARRMVRDLVERAAKV